MTNEELVSKSSHRTVMPMAEKEGLVAAPSLRDHPADAPSPLRSVKLRSHPPHASRVICSTPSNGGEGWIGGCAITARSSCGCPISTSLRRSEGYALHDRAEGTGPLRSHPSHASRAICSTASDGGARGKRMRTLKALPCLIGVVRDSWQQGYFSVHPIRKEWVEKPAPRSF